MRLVLLIAGALLGLTATAHAQLLNAQRLRLLVSSVTIADNAVGTAATATLTTTELSYVAVTCNDAQGCTVSLSETGARDGQVLVIVQVSASPGLLTFSDSAGVLELLNGTAYTTAQYEALTVQYVTDRWIEVSRTQFAGAITASDVATFTNKTYDTAGTGNVFTSTSTQWIPAARCDNATASSPEWSFPTSNPGVPACVTGSNTQFGVMDFADGALALSAQTHLMLSAEWSGTIGVKFKWLTSAITGNVVWQIQSICVANAETADPAFNTASTVTDAALGTTLQTNDAAIASLTITGCAAGELMFLKVTRDPTTAADTLAATARLMGIELTTTRAQ